MITIKIPAIAPSDRCCRSPKGHWYENPESAAFDAATKKALKGLTAPRAPYDVTVTVSPYNASAFLASRIKQTFDALTRCGFWQDDKDVDSVTLKYGRGAKIETKIVVRTKETREKL